LATVGALNGGADAYADDNAPAFRDAVAAALERPARLDLDTLRAEQARLEARLKALQRFSRRARYLACLGARRSGRDTQLTGRSLSRTGGRSQGECR
jgi:hypothetical protein